MDALPVDALPIAEIGVGFLVLLGVSPTDRLEDATKMAAKVSALRLFEDPDGRMNLGLADVDGAILCVSQFTLYTSVRKPDSTTGANVSATLRRLRRTAKSKRLTRTNARMPALMKAQATVCAAS